MKREQKTGRKRREPVKNKGERFATFAFVVGLPTVCDGGVETRRRNPIYWTENVGSRPTEMKSQTLFDESRRAFALIDSKRARRTLDAPLRIKRDYLTRFDGVFEA